MSQRYCVDCGARGCVCRLEFQGWTAWAWHYLRSLGGRRVPRVSWRRKRRERRQLAEKMRAA